MKFSKNEERVLKILRRARKPISIATLTKRFYDPKKAPRAANNYIASVVRRINDKIKYGDFPWIILGQGEGRGGRIVWLWKRRACISSVPWPW